MHRGFAKLYRKFLDWEWYEDIPCKILYVHCLLKASHKDRKYRGKEIPRGSFITGRDDLSRSTGLSNQQVRTALCKLTPSYITSTATNKGTHIFVVDFDTYNGDLSQINQHINQPGNQQSTSNQPATHHTSNQPSTTNKNVKNGENEKKKHTDDALRVAEYMLSQIETHMPDHKKWNVESWAKDIDLAIRIDKRTPRELCELAKWIHVEDPSGFDRSNVLSGKKLRDRFDQINGKRKNKPVASKNEWSMENRKML